MTLPVLILLAVLASADLRSDFNTRASSLLNSTVWSSDTGSWADLARIALRQGVVSGEGLRSSMAQMWERQDCSDFDVPAMIRILWEFGDSPLLDPDLKQELIDALLNWQYWIDEYEAWFQGNMMFWTENHQMDFHVSEYLAGYLFYNTTFPGTNMTGAQHYAKGRTFVLQWLERRYRWGHSEWKSDDYLQFQIRSTSTLASLAPDSDVKVRAAMVLDLLMYDLSVQAWAGGVASSRGRSYASAKWNQLDHSVAPVIYLLTNEGPETTGNGAAVNIALSNLLQEYIVPEVILAVGADRPASLEEWERIGIDTTEYDLAKQSGLGYSTADDGIGWWGEEAYATPQTIGLAFAMGDAWQLYRSNETTWKYFAIVRPLWEHDPDAVIAVCELIWPLSESVLGNSSTYIYRTPDAALASAQSFRPGVVAFQQHVWQATLTSAALIFTTQPGPNVNPQLDINAELDAIAACKPISSFSRAWTNTILHLASESGHDPSVVCPVTAALLAPRLLQRPSLPHGNGNGNGNAPGDNEDDYADGYWTGSASMPRVGQWTNLLIAIYNPPFPGVPELDDVIFPNLTHAYFPLNAFDVVVDNLNQSGWIMGQAGNAYVALYTSSNNITWTTTGDRAYQEIIAQGNRCAWICRIGRAAVDGNFSTFVSTIQSTQVKLNISDTPGDKGNNGPVDVSVVFGDGLMASFGWTSPLLVQSPSNPLFSPPTGTSQRYNGPYVKSAFPATSLAFQFQGSALYLNYDTGNRTVVDA